MSGYRKNYISVPIDYVRQLKSSNKRKKARAFMEYFDDVDVGEHNAVRFYARSWDVSVSTSHGWIDDFNREIDKFFNFWQLKNARHYSSVKNQSEQKPNTSNTYQADKLKELADLPEHQTNEVFNINTTTSNEIINPNLDIPFVRLMNELKTGFKNIGNIEDSYKAYLGVKNIIDSANLIKAYKKYAGDVAFNKRVGLAKFINQMIYMSYCTPTVKITVDNDTYEGVYDKEHERLLVGDKSLKCTEDRYSELNQSGNIEVVKFVA